MTTSVRAQDALDAAMGCNRGLNGLICLMAATSRENAPDIDCLCELISSIHRDLDDKLHELQRLLK